MSRSMRNSRFSFRNRVSSSRSSFISPLALRPLCSRVSDPAAQGGRLQVELAGDGAHGLAFVEDQPNRRFLQVVIELPAGAPARLASGHAGHRIHLSEDVHETGSSPDGIGL
jgi:hypothetical protein